jgi:hypothetical protein
MSSTSSQTLGLTSAAKAQKDCVVKLYNDNKANISQINALIAVYQSTKDRDEREIDALPLPHQTKIIKKSQAPRIIHLSNVLADCHAGVLTLEDFEAEFRIDWKRMRKANVEQREEFINKRVERTEKVVALLSARVRKCNEWLEMVESWVDESAPSGFRTDGDGTEEAAGSMKYAETNVPSE